MWPIGATHTFREHNKEADSWAGTGVKGREEEWVDTANVVTKDKNKDSASRTGKEKEAEKGKKRKLRRKRKRKRKEIKEETGPGSR